MFAMYFSIHVLIVVLFSLYFFNTDLINVFSEQNIKKNKKLADFLQDCSEVIVFSLIFKYYSISKHIIIIVKREYMSKY